MGATESGIFYRPKDSKTKVLLKDGFNRWKWFGSTKEKGCRLPQNHKKGGRVRGENKGTHKGKIQPSLPDLQLAMFN